MFDFGFGLDINKCSFFFGRGVEMRVEWVVWLGDPASVISNELSLECAEILSMLMSFSYNDTSALRGERCMWSNGSLVNNKHFIYYKVR